VIEVTDDGASGAGAEEGSGLRGMRERAEQHGGNLEAGPTPGGGWRVRVRFPLERLPT
jgi:signal transduction histidine kinase